METLIIQVNCTGRPYNPNGPPQLGITVEAPYSVALQQRQQQQANKDTYRNHDYQNFTMSATNGSLQFDNNTKHNNSDGNHHHQRPTNGTKTSINSTSSSSTNTSTSSSPNHHNNKHNHYHHASSGSVGTLGEHIQRGLQITQIQEGSVIDSNGQFRIGDIIVEVNGVNLQRRTFQEAQKTLREFVVKQSSHGPLLLKVLRKPASSSSLPSTTGSQSTVIERLNNFDSNTPSSSIAAATTTVTTPKKSSTNSASSPSPQSSSSTRHFVGALNTRRIGTKHRIKLNKSNDGGFGIKIAERDNMFGTNRPIYITAITTTGSAYRDGRLKEGDMLLEVNGIDLSGKSQPEVTKMLKGVGVNETVEFVVSRQEDLKIEESETRQNVENGCDNNKSLIDFDATDHDDNVRYDHFTKKIDSLLNVPNIDGPGTYIYDVPLNDTKSAGLGLYLKYPTLNRKDLGIWIEKVITGGAAWKDGRLQPDDQILAINGINLMGLSNAEASETLTAAVCRGIGPEATANTIRLHIHRRDASVVAKILQGTNNRIEHSDVPVNGHNKSYSNSERLINNSQDSYRTAFDNTLHSRSLSSNDTTSDSAKSCNQNSHNDSAMSPQTQASNSLKLSNSCNDKSDHSSSDKMNDTSSAISQITDFTTVPIADNTTPEKENSSFSDNQPAFTQPKTLELGDEGQNSNLAASIQSLDDESIDNAVTGEERFQRDGFGRQSISEKRHAQLMAKNTDTFKKNQKLREEREKQRQIEDQLERQRLDDSRRSLNLISGNNQHQRLSNTIMTNDMNSMYSKDSLVMSNQSLGNSISANNHHREVPVDVQLPVEPGIEVEPLSGQLNEGNQSGFFHSRSDSRATKMPSNNQFDHLQHQQLQQQQQNIDANQMFLANRCMRCGSIGACMCRMMNDHDQRAQMYAQHFAYDNQGLKRSNSLESIQQHDQSRQGLVVPRAGTMRVARNRKINESFRAAVDRSYEGSTNEFGRLDHSSNNHGRTNVSTKISNSIANSTTSTSNDERFLINTGNNSKQTNNNGNNGGTDNNSTSHKKSSSLLTRFLKFGSMKKDKKKNKDGQQQQTSVKTSDIKSSKEMSSREAISSQTSKAAKGTHSRTQSTQSHPLSSSFSIQHQQQQHHQNQHQLSPSQMKADVMNSQMYNNSLKQAMHQSQSQTNMDLHPQHPHRASMHMYQQQYQPMLHNFHAQNHLHHPMVQPKLAPHAISRPANVTNTHQYSHIPIHHQAVPTFPPNHPHHHMHQQQQPVNIHNHTLQYQATALNHAVPNHSHINQTNGCHPANQWQSPPPVQAPNGLWVANSPVSEAQTIHNSHQNIYGTHARHVAHMHNNQPSVSSISSHSVTPFIPSINGQNSNGIIHHQSPILQGHAPSMTQQHLHNHQPPHIYYYDF